MVLPKYQTGEHLTDDLRPYHRHQRKDCSHDPPVCMRKDIDPYIVAIDSTLLRAKGHLWHKSSMIKGIVPCSGIIDTDARWGFSHTKGWVFGYKLHITSITGSLIVPLSADFTQADVQDNQIYLAITSSLPQGVRYMELSLWI